MNLLWFKSTDLRLRDHEALKKAFKKKYKVILVFCLDPLFFENIKSDSGIKQIKFNKFKEKFLYQSLIDLHSQIKEYNGYLNIYLDSPENVIPSLVEKYEIDCIYNMQDTTSEELDQLKNIQQKLSKDVKIKSYWGNTLYHIDDLPYNVDKIPDVFSFFRKSLYSVKIREEENLNLKKLNNTIEDIDNIEVIKSKDNEIDISLEYQGGETKAWERLEYYFYQKKLLSVYKKTRNGLLGKDYSSKFSPYLAFGNISAKSIQHEINKYENTVEKNDSTYWMFFELLWRDFFRFSSLKYGKKIFFITGTKNKKLKWRKNIEETKILFNKWKNGETGYPYIDANMLELKNTGFMSNRGRQMVASFLVKDLKIDWRWGAEYFESMLIDHDVASNYGNWNYASGIGADPRQDRYFNVYKQAYTYDRNCYFVKKWIPQLKDFNKDKIINVENLEYFEPIVSIKRWKD
tara:strand:+ start:714 stop:2093 length:1380 start_codon:yes stop_codon:yes gene_type:complete